MDLSVVNSLGEAVLTRPIMPNKGGMTRAEIDLSGFAQGVYAINLSARGSVIGSRKISVAGR
jgi:hypothetical protein